MENLTTSTAELPFNDLIESDKQIRIPYYQRSYKWSRTQVDGLLSDIEEMLEGGLEREEIPAHFMGAIIVHQPPTTANQVSPIEVIDGQQRLTTIFLALLACIKALSDTPEHKEKVVALIEDYILLRQTKVAGRSNLKLNVSHGDSESMNSVVHEVVDKLAADIDKRRSFIPLISNSTVKKQKVRNNFNVLKRWASQEMLENGVDHLEEIINILLQNLTFVQIIVKDPISGPKIFDRLNSAGTPLSIAELVKNDVFSRIGTVEGNSFENFETSSWNPFYEKFLDEQTFQNYFFPYGLMEDPYTKKSDVYRSLQKKWNKENLEPEEIIKGLEKYRDDYMNICDGSANDCKHPDEITDRFQRLRDIGQPTTIYPFLMKLSYELRNKREKLDEVTDTIDVLESFLVRRATCGYEPSGLHAVFKKLWDDQFELSTKDKNLTLAERIEKVIRGHRTVTWPTKEEFSEKLKTRPIYNSGITKFLLIDYDSDLPGESPTGDNPTIEHILPQTIKSKTCWKNDFSTSKHEELKDVLGNLTLLTGGLNSAAEVSNSCYKEKRAAYGGKAMWAITREVSKSFATWKEEDIKKRSKKIAKWACDKWKY